MLTVSIPGLSAWRRSLACDVLSDGKSIGQVVFPDRSRRSGIIELGDRRYTVSPTDKREDRGRLEKLLSQGTNGPVAFEDSGGAVLGTAKPTKKSDFLLELGGAPFEFRRKSLFSATWILQAPDSPPLGSVAYQGFLGRSVAISLPDRFDDAQKCFLFWLCARWEMQQSVSTN